MAGGFPVVDENGWSEHKRVLYEKIDANRGSLISLKKEVHSLGGRLAKLELKTAVWSAIIMATIFIINTLQSFGLIKKAFELIAGE